MNTEEYYQQLQVINQTLEDCPVDTDRTELLTLKQNIEELLLLTNEVNKHTTLQSQEDEPVLIADKDSDKNNTEIDEEYAIFMAEMAKEGAIEVSSEVPNGKSTHDGESDSKRTVFESKSSKSFKDLEGKKFRAPHKHQWGQVVYHNAMVCSAPDNIPITNEFKVRVLFLNPTHKEMQPCPYYFHLEKDCNYAEEECRFSHGELVPVSSLQDYVEPKFELLREGSEVLAKEIDDLWYRAKIEEISKERCLVKFENNTFKEVIFSHILPLETSENYSDNASESDSDIEVINEDFEMQIENDRLESKRRQEELINMSLTNSPESQKLGDWEKYTKGIGSKLMQKMGYIVGTGLGKMGSGIIKPVTALVLPQGKSLDYCMNLKERQNDPNLFDADQGVTKRERKGRKKNERKTKMRALMRIEQMDVAQFLRFKYSGKKFKVSSAQTEENEFQLMREKLKSGTDKDVNTANYMVDENIKRYKEIVVSLKSTVKRLQELHSDTGKLHKRLHNRETDLKNLTTYKMMIKNEMDRRKNNKEMAVF